MQYPIEITLHCLSSRGEEKSMSIDKEDVKDINYSKETLSERKDHQYRLTGKYSTAHYKYLHIMSKETDAIITGGIFLAERAGGVTAMSHRIFGTPIIIYNSLINMSDACAHRAISFIPAEIEPIKNKIDLYGVLDSINTGGDLTKRSIMTKYKNWAKKYSRQIKVITCDAEVSGGFNEQTSDMLVDNVIEIARELQNGTLVIIKSFCHTPYTLMSQIHKLYGITTKVKIIVPTYSSYESYEVFLVCSIQSNSYGMPRVISMSRELFLTINDLSLNRLNFLPFQCSISTKVEVSLHNELLRSGYIENKKKETVT